MTSTPPFSKWASEPTRVRLAAIAGPLRGNGSGGVAGRRLEPDPVRDAMVHLDQLGEPRVQHRRDAVGEDALGPVLVLGGPVLPLPPGEEVPGAREGRHPAAVGQARVPADVI